MIEVSRAELFELREQAVDASYALARAGGAVRYLARASEVVVTDDLTCVLDLISLSLCSDQTTERLSSRLSELMKREDV